MAFWRAETNVCGMGSQGRYIGRVIAGVVDVEVDVGFGVCVVLCAHNVLLLVWWEVVADDDVAGQVGVGVTVTTFAA